MSSQPTCEPKSKSPGPVAVPDWVVSLSVSLPLRLLLLLLLLQGQAQQGAAGIRVMMLQPSAASAGAKWALLLFIATLRTQVRSKDVGVCLLQSKYSLGVIYAKRYLLIRSALGRFSPLSHSLAVSGEWFVSPQPQWAGLAGPS